jgi:fatty acid desaturase
MRGDVPAERRGSADGRRGRFVYLCFVLLMMASLFGAVFLTGTLRWVSFLVFVLGSIMTSAVQIRAHLMNHRRRNPQ